MLDPFSLFNEKVAFTWAVETADYQAQIMFLNLLNQGSIYIC
jgi:hypothetical protein